jgi:hypothetical protein
VVALVELKVNVTVEPVDGAALALSTRKAVGTAAIGANEASAASVTTT